MDNIKVAKELVKLAKTLVAQQQEQKEESNIKKLFKKVKDLLSTKTLFQHKIKNKIVDMVEKVIDKLQESEFITSNEADQLKYKLEGKNASVKTAGKGSPLFILLLTLFNLFMPLIAFCNNVPENKQNEIKKLLNTRIHCKTFSNHDIKSTKESIALTDDEERIKQHIERLEYIKKLDVYDVSQHKDTQVLSILINFKGDDERFEYLFELRTKIGSKDIIKPAKMNDADFNKVLTIIAIFDKDNKLGLRDKIDNKYIEQFVEYNKSTIQKFTEFTVLTRKDAPNETGTHVYTKTTLQHDETKETKF